MIVCKLQKLYQLYIKTSFKTKKLKLHLYTTFWIRSYYSLLILLDIASA